MAGRTFFVAVAFIISLHCFAFGSVLPEPSKANPANLLLAKLDSCALLYRTIPDSENSTHIAIKTDQYVSNVEESFRSTKENLKWSPISSFVVKSGCSLTACNATDFDGLCKTFATDTTTNLPAGFDDFRSTSCTCAKDCKCSDVHIRRTGCARAYLNQGCNSCNAYYTDFKGTKPSVPPEFRNNISSIMVRPGCTLTVYDDESFDGDNIETLGGGVTKEEWKGGQVASYECSCAPTERETPKVTKPRPENYLPEIEIPKTVDEISQLTETYGRHPGLMASLKSYKNKRSPKNAYILLLGLTGSGKSSAINLLFDNENLTKVGDGISTTTDIHEFRIPIAVNELGITNSELRVIDTPGLGDTRGLEQDARFLATLDEYLSGHEELSHRLPNVVLVFGKFDDNRYSGKGSRFVKMLNGVELFRDRLADKKYSNVIFVLSHFMSRMQDDTRRPTSRILSFKKVIEEYSLFPKPISIVVAENKAEAQGLPMLNGYFKLPNGEFYPRNLFDKIQHILTNGEDPIGEAVIRTAFRDSDDFNISAKHFTLVGSDHGKAIKYLSELSGAAFDVEKTEVSQILAQAHTGMSNDLKSAYPDALPYIQRAFNLRNIRHKIDIPKTTLEIVQLLKNIKQNEANAYLMNAAFGLKAPSLKENLMTGYSYNILEDKPLTISPFKLGDLKISDAGYMFPNIMTCEVQHETLGILRTFNSREEYVENRLRSLGVAGTVPPEHFTGTVRPGCNVYSVTSMIEYSNGNSTPTFTLSALREHRIFELTLNDRLDLTPEFTQTVKALPPFNTSDPDAVDTWKSFFSTYGTHVVKSTHGGGSIEIQLSTQEKLGTSDIAGAMFQLIQFAEDVSTGQIRRSSSNGTANGTLASAGAPKHVLKFKGGDMKFHATDLTSMSLGAAADLLENWKESIDLSPSILVTDMKLLPISQVAKKVGQNISSEIQRAALLLFNSTLKYVRPSQIPVEVPDDRQHTIQRSSSNEFTSFLQIMMQNQQKADERFQQIILQMQEEAKAAEHRREKAAAEERRWQREIEAQREQDRNKMIESERNRQLEREKYRAEQEARDREFKLQMMKMQQEEARRNAEAMANIAANSNRRGGGSCLKAGTKILTWSGTQVPVESLQVGDWIVSGDLNPAQVVGISNEFLLNQSFYGFEIEDDEGNGQIHNAAFFTDTHLFTSTNSTLYAADPQLLYYGNPLMEYFDVQEMSERFVVNQVVRSSSTSDLELVAKHAKVYRNTTRSPEDTLVYFLQVSNPSGTYFANGYMARHEIPPFFMWPKTMAVLFTWLEQPELLRPISSLPYTLENVARMRSLVDNIENDVRRIINQICRSNSTSSLSFPSDDGSTDYVKDLEDIDTDSLIDEIFNNPSLSALAMGVYSTSGKIIAKHLDLGACEHRQNDMDRIQVQLVKAISYTVKSSSF